MTRWLQFQIPVLAQNPTAPALVRFGAHQFESGLLIDVARDLGADRIAQVDLGERIHRNRPLHELRPQAIDVLRAALERAGSLS